MKLIRFHTSRSDNICSCKCNKQAIHWNCPSNRVKLEKSKNLITDRVTKHITNSINFISWLFITNEWNNNVYQFALVVKPAATVEILLFTLLPPQNGKNYFEIFNCVEIMHYSNVQNDMVKIIDNFTATVMESKTRIMIWIRIPVFFKLLFYNHFS